MVGNWAGTTTCQTSGGVCFICVMLLQLLSVSWCGGSVWEEATYLSTHSSGGWEPRIEVHLWSKPMKYHVMHKHICSFHQLLVYNDTLIVVWLARAVTVYHLCECLILRLDSCLIYCSPSSSCWYFAHFKLQWWYISADLCNPILPGSITNNNSI